MSSILEVGKVVNFVSEFNGVVGYNPVTIQELIDDLAVVKHLGFEDVEPFKVHVTRLKYAPAYN